jgi:hypothetical protein
MNMDISRQSTLAPQAMSTMARRRLSKPLQESGPALIVKSLEEASPSKLAMPMLLFTSVLTAPRQYVIALNPNVLTAEVKVNFSA